MNRSQIRELFNKSIDDDNLDSRYVIYNAIIDDIEKRILELIDCRCNFALVETIRDELDRMKVSIYK